MRRRGREESGRQPFAHLRPGGRYRVARPFRDHDGIDHPAGEAWTFLGSNFLPYEDGLTLHVLSPGGPERTIRLQWRAEAEGAVIEALDRHVADDPASAGSVEPKPPRTPPRGRFMRLLRAIVGCAALLVLSGAAWGGADLPGGPALVVIAPDDPSTRDRESEAYFDWAAHLDDFLAVKPPALAFARMSPERWRAAGGRRADESYGTAFLRRDGSMLIRQGMVLDPPVYAAGARWALGAAPAGLAAMGFEAVRPAGPRR